MIPSTFPPPATAVHECGPLQAFRRAEPEAATGQRCGVARDRDRQLDAGLAPPIPMQLRRPSERWETSPLSCSLGSTKRNKLQDRRTRLTKAGLQQRAASRSPSRAKARMPSRVAVGPRGSFSARPPIRQREARGASTPRVQHPARIVQPVRAEIGLQQREPTRSSCARLPPMRSSRRRSVQAPRSRRRNLAVRKRRRPATPPERRGRTDNDPHAQARRSAARATPAPRHRPPRPARAQCACRKSRAGARKRAVREVVHHAPCIGVARMPGEFPAPQKRNRIVQLPARRSAVHLGREGFPEQPERRRRIAGLEMAECEMPTQMAVQRSRHADRS